MGARRSGKRRHPDFTIPAGSDPGWIYFALASAARKVKIGYSEDHPELRFQALHTGCPEQLTRLGAMRGLRWHERELHRRFGHLRVRGEWFEDDPEIREFIAAHVDPWPEDRFGQNEPLAPEDWAARQARWIRDSADWHAKRFRELHLCAQCGDRLDTPIDPARVAERAKAEFAEWLEAAIIGRDLSPVEREILERRMDWLMRRSP